MKRLLLGLPILFAAQASADVAVQFPLIDNTVAPELAGYVTQDIRVMTTNDWSSSAMLLSLTGGSVYQDTSPVAGNGPPASVFFQFFPSLAFDTYVGIIDGETDIIVGAAGDLGGGPYTFDTQKLDVTWFNVPSGLTQTGLDYGLNAIGRLSLSNDAQGTLAFSISEADKQLVVYEFPVEGGRVIVPHVPPPDPGPCDDQCFGGGLIALDRILVNWNAQTIAGDVVGGDYNHDGFVGLDDLDTILQLWGIKTFQETADLIYDHPVDSGGDGMIYLEELDTVINLWNQAVTPGAPADYNGDGYISQDDLNAVLSAWSDGTPPAAKSVPEPATLLLTAGVIVGLRGTHRSC